MAKNKGILVVAATVLVLAGAAAVNLMAEDTTVITPYITLGKGALMNSISVKGVVESTGKKNIYSPVNGTVQTVHVEVGDRVEAGQLLIELDTEDLELNIAQQKADLTTSEQSNLNQLQNNIRLYNEAQSNMSSGTNSQVLNAENAIKTTAESLKSAQKSYDDLLTEYNDGTNSQLTSAQSNLKSLKLDLENAEETLEKNRTLYTAGIISKEQFTQSETAHTNAKLRYDDALTNYDNVLISLERSLEQAEQSRNAAQIAYDNAVAARDATQTAAEQELERHKSNVQSSEIAANNDSRIVAIQRLEKQLENSYIKSPISGTVTAVYAKEGTNSGGLLMVIEDIDNLKITTKIKEYDIKKLELGMPVIIKSDSTGDEEYEGRVSKIEPAAVKNANGENASLSDVEFGAEIEVTSKESGLMVGMNTRLSIVLERKEDVYYVPYDAIAAEENGDIIYTAEKAEKDGYTAKPVAVTTGMETDFYIEIEGGGLTEGMIVLTDTAQLQDNAKVALD